MVPMEQVVRATASVATVVTDNWCSGSTVRAPECSVVVVAAAALVQRELVERAAPVAAVLRQPLVLRLLLVRVIVVAVVAAVTNLRALAMVQAVELVL